MTTTKTNKEAIANAFDSTFSAIQTICKDFKEKHIIRSKDLFLQEQVSQAETTNNEYQQYYAF